MEQGYGTINQHQCHDPIQDLLVILKEFLEKGAEQYPADIGDQHYKPVDDQRQHKHPHRSVIREYKIGDQRHTIQKPLGIHKLQDHPRMNRGGIQMEPLLFLFFRLRFIPPDDPRQIKDIQSPQRCHDFDDDRDVIIYEEIASDGDQQDDGKARRYAKTETQAFPEAVFGAVCHAHQVIGPRCDTANNNVGKKSKPVEHSTFSSSAVFS